MAAEREGQARADLGRVSDLPSEEEWAAMATPESKARMDTTIVKLVSDWTTRIRNTGYPVTRGQSDWQPRPASREGRRRGRHRLELREPDERRVGHLHRLRHQEQDVAGDRDELRRLRPALSPHREESASAAARQRHEPERSAKCRSTTRSARSRASEKPNEIILFSAHFDSWDGSQGATDNGTGTITMMEAMRILKTAYPHPKRTIIVGHWPGEEQGLIGSHAFAYDHPEIVREIQAGFNQDNGTGRIQSTSGVGLPDGGAHMQAWLAKLPQEFQNQIKFTGVGAPATGGTDNASFDCYGAPVFGLGALGWDYGSYTHHTNRDSFDKIVFDDLKGNATIVAMLAYLASEDPTFITRERAST